VKIEEYLASLPPSIMSGEDVQLPDNSIREILNVVKLGKQDVFFHLGCGSGNSLGIAAKIAKKAIGVDINRKKIAEAKENSASTKNIELRCEDIMETDLSDATVVLFWFSDTKTVEKMTARFARLNSGVRIITIFDPLPGVLPVLVSFPYLVHEVPFRPAQDLREQLMKVFDTECIDFTTAWEFAERYTKAIGSPEVGNDRFLTILQTLMIWINARNLGLSCTKEIPPPVKSYMEILQNFFNIEMEHLLKN
jgi:SAM-dependent methyltransferase